MEIQTWPSFTELEQDEYTISCEHAFTNSMNEIKQRYLKLNTIFFVTLTPATNASNVLRVERPKGAFLMAIVRHNYDPIAV